MKVALDTDAYTGFMRGEPTTVQVVRAASEIVLPLIVLAELRAGFAAGNQQTSNESSLVRFLASPRVSVLCADEETATYYADVFVSFAAKALRSR